MKTELWEQIYESMTCNVIEEYRRSEKSQTQRYGNAAKVDDDAGSPRAVTAILFKKYTQYSLGFIHFSFLIVG